MDRVIKFRGKTKTVEGDKWVYGYLYKIKSFFSAAYQYFIKNEHLQETAVDETSIGQFTGLYDKNGNEIYEGDIVKSILILQDGTALKSNTDIVEWNEIECSFMLGKGIRHFHEHLILEVIGNIYDNKNLLEEE